MHKRALPVRTRAAAGAVFGNADLRALILAEVTRAFRARLEIALLATYAHIKTILGGTGLGTVYGCVYKDKCYLTKQAELLENWQAILRRPTFFKDWYKNEQRVYSQRIVRQYGFLRNT